MNFGKNPAKSSHSGNAMIYVLLALALIGLLTATIMRQDDSETSDISQEQAEFLATQVLEYTASAQNAVDQMLMSGSGPDDIDFALPSATSFNTGPFIHKLFHPSGGGLNYKAAGTGDNKFDWANPATNPLPGFYVTMPGNIEWTPTTAQDVVFVAYLIPKSICETINKKLTGSASIPPITNGNVKDKLVNAASVGFAYINSDLLAADCAACEGYSTLCVSDSGATSYVLYSILVGR